VARCIYPHLYLRELREVLTLNAQVQRQELLIKLYRVLDLFILNDFFELLLEVCEHSSWDLLSRELIRTKEVIFTRNYLWLLAFLLPFRLLCNFIFDFNFHKYLFVLLKLEQLLMHLHLRQRIKHEWPFLRLQIAFLVLD
jgi:hypothetical protein